MDAITYATEGITNLNKNVFGSVTSMFSGSEGTLKKNTFISTCPALYSTLPYCFSIVFGLCVMEFQQFKLCPPFLVILEISFDPMKVVSDAVEEITDRRNMFLSYLSGVLMQDKGDRY